MQNWIWLLSGALSIGLLATGGMLALRALRHQDLGLMGTAFLMVGAGFLLLLIVLGLTLAVAGRDMAVANTGKETGLVLIEVFREIVKALAGVGTGE